MDMKWLDNLITVFACGETGVCPYCGSPDADHGFTVIKKDTRMGYGSVWCNTCKRGIPLSRVIVPEYVRQQEAPHEIVYR